MPARAPASMLMLQRVMRPSMESARIADPAYSITQPVAPSVPMWPMMPSAISFAVTAGGKLAIHRDAKSFGQRLRQTLRGQNVFHFRSADAERQRAECSVGAGVAVAADDGHARLGQAQLRADDMHDPLLRRMHVVERNAELGAVAPARYPSVWPRSRLR